MANSIRYAVSMSFIDEYTVPSVDATGEDGDEIVVPARTVQQHHSDVGKARGSSSMYDVVGAAVDQSDVVVDNNATPQSLGTFNLIKGVVIKHSGYSSVARTILSGSSLIVYVGGEQICRLSPFMAVALPSSYGTTYTITARSYHSTDICVEVTRSN